MSEVISHPCLISTALKLGHPLITTTQNFTWKYKIYTYLDIILIINVENIMSCQVLSNVRYRHHSVFQLQDDVSYLKENCESLITMEVNSTPHDRSLWLNQSGRSPKVVALVSATSYIIQYLQLHDTFQIKWSYAWVHYNIAIRSHLMIYGTKFSSIFLLHGKHLFGKLINEVWYQACDLMWLIQQTHI